MAKKRESIKSSSKVEATVDSNLENSLERLCKARKCSRANLVRKAIHFYVGLHLHEDFRDELVDELVAIVSRRIIEKIGRESLGDLVSNAMATSPQLLLPGFEKF